MKTSRIARIGAIGAIAMLALAGCAANEQPAGGGSTTDSNGSDSTSNGGSTDNGGATLSGSLAGSGASSQGKAQEAWIAEFTTANSGVSIAYDGGGSGTGRTAFIEGGVDFAGSDRAFKTEEIEDEKNEFKACAADSDLVELPLYISPIAIGFNVPGVDELNLDSDTIAKIFSNQITAWNDPAIAALNEGTELPDTKITPIHRSTNSGTTENFVDYLAKTAPDVWTYEVSGDWPEAITSGQEAAAETADVAGALGNEGTIGYIDASRAPGTTASVKVGDSFVAYSPEGAAAVVDASPLDEGRAATDIAVALDRTTTAENAYPVVLISYLVGCAEYADADQGALVKEYFSYMASEEGQTVAAEAAGAAPISAELRSKVETAIATIK